ncbi:SIR2 family protein [Clostridium beijerinckii]|uniref:SIR2 family protein n=1 Tax=Clostridium beijerinckii TaxID=1520 RepID=UPI00242E494E|nr:SIR2 family protein [Clostridium beijerinckii]MDG5855265.1 SIR2 family protein [Clostridium beijerinckii]
MKLSDKVEYIRQAKEENRLVIFVGAGVSFNSGIPQWKGLIQQFAKSLVYYKCKKCEYAKKDKNCSENRDCSISSDEYLKIPQYYYNKHKRKYFDIIRNVLSITAKPNDLNKIIMQLQPKHIITTNYDKLIENTNSANRAIYKVIYKDEDLLDTYSNNYIIKMHGDIEKLENIVLKEDDYLSYSQKHILIETIIKSLLLDHTFLFVGYSLNDYNLKLIMKWRDIIADSYKKSKDKCKSFIIDPSSHEKYEINYLESNGIYVIDDKDVTDDIVNKYSKDIKMNPFGKRVYSVLNIINDFKSEMSDIINDSVGINQLDILYDKLQIFMNRKKIALCELNNVIGINSLGQVLEESLAIREYKIYKGIVELIEKDNKKSNYIKEVFAKSGILEVRFWVGNEKYELYSGYEFSDMLKLSFQNNFDKMYIDILKKPDSLEKAYYLYLCNPSDPKIEMILTKLNNSYSEENDIFSLMQLKLNLIFCKQSKLNRAKNEVIEFRTTWNNTRESIKRSYKQLYNIFVNEWNQRENRKDFEMLDNIYTRKTSLLYSGYNGLYYLYKMQRYSYDYYYYCKLNLIMIDYFSNIKTALEPYIRAMLCTYTRKKEKTIDNFGDEDYEVEKLLEYKLNNLDFEFLVKYINNQDLEAYFREYSIKKLNFDEEISYKNIAQYFYNLCENVDSRVEKYRSEYIKNYLLVLSRCEFKDEHIEKIIKGIVLLIDKNIIYYEIIDQIIIFARSIKGLKIKNIKLLLQTILSVNVINKIESRNHYLKLRELFEQLTLDEYKSEFDREVRILIDNKQQLAHRIIELNFLITEEYKKELKEVIVEHLKIIDSESLFRLLVDKYIAYDRNVENRFIYIIEENIESKKDGTHTCPDWLAETLKFVVILHVMGILGDLKYFNKYAEYSIYIEFILYPDNFDYSKIHMEDYMWINLFNNNKYRKILLKNGYNVIKEKLSAAIEGMYATEEEKSIYYRYFNKIYLN